ncbi:MAG: hypothetical protein DRO15_08100 [Thermoprotei archaeon]|nr:MAG: hypothetical protein DRO15_08100 [Thermoprotei archaeon]
MSRNIIKASLTFQDLKAAKKTPRFRLLSEYIFESTFRSDYRFKILNALAERNFYASDLASHLGISRTAIYRHLSMLEKYGWIGRDEENRYALIADVFLVFRVIPRSKESMNIEILTDKGAFASKRSGFVVVKPNAHLCGGCDAASNCLKIVKSMARHFNVKIRSETPAKAFIEILATLASRDFIKIARKSYMVLMGAE